MSVYYWIVLALVLFGAVSFLSFHILGKRLGGIHQWLDGMRTRLERFEKELAHLEQEVVALQKPDPRIGTVAKRLASFTQQVAKDQQAIAQALASLEQEQSRISSRCDQLNQQQEPIQVNTNNPRSADASSLFSAPVAQDVLELLRQGLPSQDIARKTGLQIGEIDLIRDLKYFAAKDKASP